MLGRALDLFISWVVTAFAVLIIAVAWLAHFGFLEAIGGWSLGFIEDSLVWPIIFTVVGLFVLALGRVIGRSS